MLAFTLTPCKRQRYNLRMNGNIHMRLMTHITNTVRNATNKSTLAPSVLTISSCVQSSRYPSKIRITTRCVTMRHDWVMRSSSMIIDCKRWMTSTQIGQSWSPCLFALLPQTLACIGLPAHARVPIIQFVSLSCRKFFWVQTLDFCI